MAELLQVYLCYATPTREFVRAMKVEPGTTIGHAIEQSGVLDEFPDLDLATQPVGIYAKKKTLDTVLRERDRVEIYRPLLADPKESRRKRAAKKDAKAASPSP
jgi:putative ubiquitin-RnfH superfamily antitoxin RatB of RatAB toxin-antitoxin module